MVRAEVDYHKPAVLGDEVEVTVEPMSVASRPIHARPRTSIAAPISTKLVSAQITVACLTPEGRITTVPPSLADSLSQRLRP